jgi:PKD repeat protein
VANTKYYLDNLKSAKSGFNNDTIYVEQYSSVEFQALANGLNIISWQWTFVDDGSHSASPQPSHAFNLLPNSITSVSLLGIDAGGGSHTRVKPVRVVWTLDGQPGFRWVSSTLISGNLYNVVCIANRRAMIGYSGLYGFSGDMTSPQWTTQTIASTDTSWNYVNGSLVAADAGAVGKYVVIRFTATPGDHDLAIGRISPTTGGLSWATFWGPYASGNLVKFTVDNNGNVTPFIPVVLPGTSGDIGRNAVIRKDITDTSVVLFINNRAAFASLTNPFVKFQDSTGVYRDTVAQTAVIGFPDWGTVEVRYSQFLISGVLIFQFGYNGSLATYMMESSYKQPSENNLKMQVASFPMP